MVVRLHAKFLELARVVRADPARGMDIDRVKHALHAVFILQAKRHDLELQRADGAQNELVVAHRLEELRRALLAQLHQALGERLHAQRILQHRAAEELRREIGDTGEG